MPASLSFVSPFVRLMLLSALIATSGISSAAPADLCSPDNLVAWCIVPFDAKKRDPEQRAEMLQRLGFRHYAYDWRAEHVPTFDAEILATQKREIEFTAWWFPQKLDDNARKILAVI